MADQVQMKVYVDASLVAWLDQEEARYKRSRSYLVNEAIQVRKKTLEARRKPIEEVTKKGQE